MNASSLRRRLLEIRRRDDARRRELVERGELFDGYHPEMEAVHFENARELEAILDAEGWPRRSAVGDDGSDAAWKVAVHAIGLPRFQRRCLEALSDAVAAGEATPRQAAVLLDRIRFNERRPQVYGTILDWDRSGEMSPWTLEDPDGVDERRRRVGLPPLAEDVRRIREETRRDGGRPPASWEARQAEIEAWARRTGWLVD